MNLLFPLTTTKICPFHYIRQLTYVIKWKIFCGGQRKQQIDSPIHRAGVFYDILNVGYVGVISLTEG
jgi:hypothetical protein